MLFVHFGRLRLMVQASIRNESSTLLNLPIVALLIIQLPRWLYFGYVSSNDMRHLDM
jgi:hypothetical protein